MKKNMTLAVLGLLILMSVTAVGADTIKIVSLMSLTAALAP